MKKFDATKIIDNQMRRRVGMHLGFAIGSRKIVYCYIRKNACSSMKNLMLKMSGCNHEYWEKPFPFNNYIVTGGVDRLLEFDSRIFIYRDPVERLVSIYNDKFVQRKKESSNKDMFANYYKKLGHIPERASFIEFILNYSTLAWDKDIDPHLFPQELHLYPITYTHAININDLMRSMCCVVGEGVAKRFFEKRTNATSNIKYEEPCWFMEASELHNFYLRTGKIPSYGALVTEEIESVIKSVYQSDFAMIERIRQSY